MDHVPDHSELLGSGAEREDLHSGSSHLALRALKFGSFEDIQRLVERYRSLDFPRMHETAFLAHLTQRRDAWFVEVEDVGLVGITDIVPGWTGNVTFVFWDRKLSRDRRIAVLDVIASAASDFELARFSGTAPASARPLCNAFRKCGFALEGVCRKGWPGPQGFEDLHMYGLLREDIPWRQVRTISSV